MQNTNDQVKNRIDHLVSMGRGLLQRLNNNGIGDFSLPGDMSSWISLVTSELLALMPEESSDYGELVRIRTDHAGRESILLPSSGDDIRRILKNLGVARDCVIASLNADAKDIPPANLAHIYHEQLTRSVDYAKTELIARLVGKEDGRTRNTAMLHTYGRIYMWTVNFRTLCSDDVDVG